MVFKRKVYGEAKISNCPFCNKQATTKNSQGIPTCFHHKNTDLIANFKCLCGSWLDLKEGKYGSYFNCINCGNISFDRGLEINPNWKKECEKENPHAFSTPQERKPTHKVYMESGRKITEVKSSDLDFL